MPNITTNEQGIPEYHGGLDGMPMPMTMSMPMPMAASNGMNGIPLATPLFYCSQRQLHQILENPQMIGWWWTVAGALVLLYIINIIYIELYPYASFECKLYVYCAIAYLVGNALFRIYIPCYLLRLLADPKETYDQLYSARLIMLISTHVLLWSIQTALICFGGVLLWEGNHKLDGLYHIIQADVIFLMVLFGVSYLPWMLVIVDFVGWQCRIVYQTFVQLVYFETYYDIEQPR